MVSLGLIVVFILVRCGDISGLNVGGIFVRIWMFFDNNSYKECKKSFKFYLVFNGN